MNSMPNPKQPDPRDLAVTALAHAYEQIGRVDEQLPRLHEQFSKDAGCDPSDQQKRPAVPASRRTLALQGLIGLLFAACICVAAFAWQSPYGRAAKLVIAPWAPQHVSTSSLSFGKPELQARPSPPTVGAATADAALSQPARQALLAQTTPQDAASIAAPMSPELAQGLKTMARDLANVEQRIEQLKTSQEQMIRDNADLAEQLRATQAQMARDNANAAEQIKASQEQMARLVAKASEQNLRPRTSAVPARPIATPNRKSVPTLLSPQARAQPQVPMRSQPEKQ